MKVIDVHTHIFPDAIAEKATNVIVDCFPPPEPTHHRGKAEELAAALHKAGIRYAMVFAAATSPRQVENIHRFIANQAQKHAEFIPCGTLHADYENYREEFKWLREHEIYGIKVHPEMQKFALDDPRLMPMYAEMEKNDMFLIAHMGDPRSSLSDPERMLNIAKTFPKLRCIACHLGDWGSWRRDKILPLTKLPNVYTEISSTFNYFSGEPDTLYSIIHDYDPTHIFYGSDYPVWCPVKELEKARQLDLAPQLLEDILYNNFARFYHYKQL